MAVVMIISIKLPNTHCLCIDALSSVCVIHKSLCSISTECVVARNPYAAHEICGLPRNLHQGLFQAPLGAYLVYNKKLFISIGYI